MTFFRLAIAAFIGGEIDRQMGTDRQAQSGRYAGRDKQAERVSRMDQQRQTSGDRPTLP